MNTYVHAKEQVELLKKRNLNFKKISMKEAVQILINESFYYRLVSYKHYFSSYSLDENGDDNFGGIDFYDLYELSLIDKIIREELNKISLDIETYFKSNIILNIENNDAIENPTFVYNDILDIDSRYHIVDKMKKRVSIFDDVYSKKMLKKYPNMKPIWVLHEYLSFGEMLEIMKKFVKVYDYELFSKNEKYLHSVKIIRNITVHSNKLFVSKNNYYEDYNSLKKDYKDNFNFELEYDYFNNHFKYNVMSTLYMHKMLAPSYVFEQRMDDLFLKLHQIIKKYDLINDYKHEAVVNDILLIYKVVNKLY